MHGRSSVLIGAAAASGLGSVLLAIVHLNTLLLVPGVLFAACVVIPWARMCGWRLWRISLMAVLCVLGYAVAHVIAGVSEFVAAPIGAGIGTAIMLIPAFADDVPAVRRVAWRALIVGIVAAFVFTASAFVPGGWGGLLLGIIVWQVAVAAALAKAVDPILITRMPLGGEKEGTPSNCIA